MRKNELEESRYFNEIITKGEIGHLGMMDSKGFPRIIPLNYVYTNDVIYFHGALEGEKFELSQSKPKVAFSVNINYSILPSYWMSQHNACPASILYKSVQMRGTIEIINDTDEKAFALQALMEKYQPEGKHKPITSLEPIYKKEIERTGIFKITPIETDTKVQLAQTKSETKRKELIKLLNERNQGVDKETAQEIAKTLNQ